MKKAMWIVAAVVAVSFAYSLGPDIARYLKIKSM
jgi:hypothetical protein